MLLTAGHWAKWKKYTKKISIWIFFYKNTLYNDDNVDDVNVVVVYFYVYFQFFFVTGFLYGFFSWFFYIFEQGTTL